MLLESFSQSILRWLRIPPGTSLRKYSNTSSNQTPIEEDDYVSSIVDITVDDICIGDTPLSINCDVNTPDVVKAKFEQINEEFNSVVKWVARDLCISGFSVYKLHVNKKLNRLVVLPYLEELDFYWTSEKELVAFEKESDTKKSVEDLLIFINTDKSNLSKVEDDNFKKFAFKVTPVPMQLKNASNIINKITIAENAISRYRASTSRYARWANVDVGLSQGDTQKATIDSISSAINADSMDLSITSEANTFNDNIPVIPNRKGLGKPEIQESKADVNIKDLADLDYWLSKLNLKMRFPATYLDFSKNLDTTAVSLLRGDLRYKKLCSSVSTKIVNTLNDFINSSKKFSKYHPVFALTQLPSSEDEDVMEAFDNYLDLASKTEEFVNVEGSVELKLHRLKLLEDLFNLSTTSPLLQCWFNDFREYIQKDLETTSGDLPSPSGGGGPESFEGPEISSDEAPDLAEDLENESPEEVEFIEPQSTNE